MTAGVPPWRVSRRSLARWGGPVSWMALGALALHLWRTWDPGPSPSAAASTARVTLSARPDGIYCARPDALPAVAVLNVVDGDTAEILWQGVPTFLRYFGVNTPERGHPCYDIATARNRALSGTVVRLAFEERDRDRYGRLLAYVFTPDGLSVDAQLVADGVGRAWRRDGRFRDTLAGLEDRARASKTGCLWDGSGPARPSPRRKKTSS